MRKSERMYRLMRIEKEKAKERQNLGLKSDEGSRADDATAEAFGIGRDTMRKEMQIVENKRRVYKKFRIHKMCSIYSKSVHTTQKEQDIHIISCAISTKYI